MATLSQADCCRYQVLNAGALTTGPYTWFWNNKTGSYYQYTTSGWQQKTWANGAVGRFAIRGRCLELRIGEERRTPVFMGQTGVEGDGLVVRGRKLPYGREVRLMSISAPFHLAEIPNRACPAQGVFLRSIED